MAMSNKQLGSDVGAYSGLVLGGPQGMMMGSNIGSAVGGGGIGGLESMVGMKPGGVNAGLNIPALQAAQPVNPFTQQNIGQANQGIGNSLASQNALIAALQGQGGIGNQATMFNQAQGLGGQLGNVGGIQAQQAALGGLGNVYAQQQGLAHQLQNIAAGRGPNPAQAMLNQQTGQNVANQAALMAGQRGAGSNVGLIARQAAQQGAATQQQAVGQGATMQAQQSLGALGQLGGQQQAMAGTAGQMAGIGAQNIAQQQAQQQLGANIAQSQIGNLLGAQSTGLQGNLGFAGQQLGALGQYNANQVAAQNALLAAQSAQNVTAMGGRQNLLGSALGGLGGALPMAGSALGSLFGSSGAEAAGMTAGEVDAAQVAADASDTAARGGMVKGKKMAAGGPVSTLPPGQRAPSQQIAGTMTPDASQFAAPMVQAPMVQGPQSALGKYLQSGNITGNIKQDQGQQMAMGGQTHDYRGGGHVVAKTPKEKPVKSGNSYSNDKINAFLSAGEIVIPRSVSLGKDPVRGSAEFVRKVLAKRRAS